MVRGAQSMCASPASGEGTRAPRTARAWLVMCEEEASRVEPTGRGWQRNSCTVSVQSENVFRVARATWQCSEGRGSVALGNLREHRDVLRVDVRKSVVETTIELCVEMELVCGLLVEDEHVRSGTFRWAHLS